MNKKELTEADIRTKFITPALAGPDGSKWNLMTQLREEVYFTRGRVIVRGKTVKRGEAKKIDYILFYKPGIPIAIVEAKDNNHAVGAGRQQAIGYAEILDVPFAYSSNGDAFLEHDRTGTLGAVEREIPLDEFPSPEDLWARKVCWQPRDRPAGCNTLREGGSGELATYLRHHLRHGLGYGMDGHVFALPRARNVMR
jgi:type I restriction enzyme R subunit